MQRLVSAKAFKIGNISNSHFKSINNISEYLALVIVAIEACIYLCMHAAIAILA